MTSFLKHHISKTGTILRQTHNTIICNNYLENSYIEVKLSIKQQNSEILK